MPPVTPPPPIIASDPSIQAIPSDTQSLEPSIQAQTNETNPNPIDTDQKPCTIIKSDQDQASQLKKSGKSIALRKSLPKPDEELKKENITKPNLQSPLSTNQSVTKLCKKTTQITPVASASSTKTPNLHKNNSNKNANILTAALVNESSDSSDSGSSDFDDANSRKILLKQNSIIKAVENASGSGDMTVKNSYANVLGKFYSRKHSSMASALELAANEMEIAMTKITKRGRQSSSSTNLPADLRMGNYPAKVNPV